MRTRSLISKTTSMNAVAGGLRTACATRLLSLLPLLLLTMPVAVQAEDYTYTTNNGTITITKYTGSGGAVIIPSTINGLPVASIGNSAFYNCTSLTSVTIGTNITNIGSDAFERCTSLATITIPYSVTTIGIAAFYGCSSLTAITVDTNNPAYSSLAGVLFNKNQTTLLQCPGGKAGSYSIPNSVTTIGYYALTYCWSLTSVMIPNSVTSIQFNAFFGCSGLANVTIPSSVTSIGYEVFGDCSSLTAITVDTNNPAYSSVVGVLFNKSQTMLIACPGGKAGTTYTIPSSVTSIGVYAFSYCSRLTNVTIPSSVTSIQALAFNGCSGLTSVTIPNSVATIENDAFQGCSGLTSVMIPNSVTRIGQVPFNLCARLTTITVDALNPAYSSVAGVLFDKSQAILIEYPLGKAGTAYTIPNSVTSIGYGVFWGCSSLTNVTIGNSVTNIGDYAFSYCSGLTGVYFQGNAPSLGGGSVFSGANVIVYYLSGTAGWGSTFGGRPTALCNSPPVIATQPTNQTVLAGGSFTFNVEAVSTPPLYYQWRKNGTNLVNGGNISGAATTSLTIANVQTNDEGSYSVVVTNAYGSVTSSPALLVVLQESQGQESLVFQQVAAGDGHTVAVKTDGTLWVWGDNGFGQLGDGTTVSKSNPVKIGGATNWQTVAAGDYHTVALKSDGTLWTWGRNDYGQLGDGTTANKSSPLRIGSATNWRAVAAGWSHSVAVKTDGTLWAWGGNADGQLGDGTTANKSSPVQIGGGTNWQSLAAGWYHTVAIKTDGTLWAWGWNSYGQLGDGTTTNRSSPVQIGLATNWQSVAAGAYHTVAVKTDDTLWAWGRNYEGQLGDGTTVSKSSPVQIGRASNWQMVAAGQSHTVAVKTDGTLWDWGQNFYGQLGDGTTANKSSPVQIGLASNWQSVAAGDIYTVAVKADGTLWAWGLQLGLGPVNWVFSPAQIGTATNWLSVTAGGTHTLARKTDRTLWAGGNNDYGQLGDGTTVYKSSPVPVGSAANWLSVAGGYYHTVAVKADGTLWAWGYNGYGQLGDGTTTSKSSPLQIGSATNWQTVAAGGYHTVGLKTDGTLWAWGYNGHGELGDGTTTNRSGPVQIGSATNWQTVAAGYNHTMAVKADGTLWACGYNGYGQLGDGTTTSKSSPVQIGSATNWRTVAAGNSHTVALKTDGTLWAWGNNDYGRLGDASRAPRITPVKIGVPVILEQPVSLVSALGATVTFGVTPAGSMPIFCQWQKDGTNLANTACVSGVTTTNVTITHIQLTDAGSYSVVVTNAYGSVTSSVAVLTISVPPAITGQPASRTNIVGTTATFTVAATGMAPLAYQWRKDATNLANTTSVSGVTTTNLTITNLQLPDAGSYSVVVANAYGSVTSSLALLTLICPPEINVQPTNQHAPAGAVVSFRVAATGKEPLRYQWFSNGTNLVDGGKISGATTATLTLSNIQTAEMGFYSVRVTDANGLATSTVALLQLVPLAAWGDNTYGQTTIPSGLSNVVAVAGGYAHSLALKADGTVVAWGYNYYGQTNVPAGLSNVVGVAAGDYHSLALKANGTVVAWGYGYAGVTNVPAELSNVVAVVGGQLHSLALREDGMVVAWGYNSSGQVNVPAGLNNVVAVAGGGDHSLALKANGTVVAWGDNSYGQNNVPAGLSNVIGVAAGYSHSLALKANGTVLAWGYGYSGVTNVPAGLSNVVAVAGGSSHSLAVRADGTVLAWGSNSSGQTDVPAGLTNVVVVAGGSAHSLALIGNGPPFLTAPLVDRPAAVGGRVSFRAAASGCLPMSYQWQCNGTNLLNATNAVLLLGDVQVAQAGNYAVTVSNALGAVTSNPARLSVLAAVIWTQPQSQGSFFGGTAVFTVGVETWLPVAYQWQMNGTNLPGATNTSLLLSNLTLASEGRYWLVISNADGVFRSVEAVLSVSWIAAWGNNNYGQTTVPAGLSNVIAVAGGYTHSLALKADERVVAWGWGGANGGGASVNNVPADLTNAVAVAAGEDFSFAQRADGTVVCWGGGSSHPFRIPAGLANVVAIAAGAVHGLALRNDGTVAAWGWDISRQSTVPVGLKDVVAVAAGNQQSLALRSDGTVVAWGSQTTTPPDLTNVVAIAAGGYYENIALKADGTVVSWAGSSSRVITTNAVAVASGGGHNLALRVDGSVIAWGQNSYGETNVPQNLTMVKSVAAGGNHSLALIGNGGPTITAQPNLGWQIVDPASSVRLRVLAVGSTPLQYQWFLNGTNLAGATNATLFLGNFQLANAGTYRCVVSNAVGLVESRDSVLYLHDPSLITLQPQDVTVRAGDAAQFSVGAICTNTVKYQWQKDGVEVFDDSTIDGCQSPTLTILNAQGNLSRIYSAWVTCGLKAAQSGSADLRVTPLVAWGADIYWQCTMYGQCAVPRGLNNVIGIAAGRSHSLALLTDGSVVSWGSQTIVPANATNVIAISAGGAQSSQSFALRADGTVVSWGGAASAVPSNLADVVSVVGGVGHAVALKADGTVVAWGDNYDHATEVPAGLSNVVAIGSGDWHSLAVKADGTVVQWGYTTNVPIGLSNVVAVAGGWQGSAALKSDGTVVVWNSGYPPFSYPPAEVTNVVAFATAMMQGMALRADGTVISWPDSGDSPVGLSNITAISVGAHHLALASEQRPSLLLQPRSRIVGLGDSVALRSLAVGMPPLGYRWRFNGTNLAGATNAWLYIPVTQAGNAGAYSVIVSNSFGVVTSIVANLTVAAAPVCAISTATNAGLKFGLTGTLGILYDIEKSTNLVNWTFLGRVRAPIVLDIDQLDPSWRTSPRGFFRAILAPNQEDLPPTITKQPDGVVAALGQGAAFAVQATGNLPMQYQWRFNGASLLGETNAVLVITNAQVSQMGNYSVIVSNAYGSVTSSVAVLTVTSSQGSTVVVWGADQLSQTNVPGGMTNVAAIAAGEQHCLALQGDGTVVGWGRNDSGAATGVRTTSPPWTGAGQVTIQGQVLTNVVAVDGGSLHSLALCDDGTVVSWGSYPMSLVPSGLCDVKEISAGGYHALALLSNGTVYAWGDNYRGQVTGVPTSQNYTNGLVSIGGQLLTNIISVAAGWGHSVALRSDGTVVAWGYNGEGQTNVPSGLNRVVRIAATGYHTLAIRSDGTVVGWGQNSFGECVPPSDIGSLSDVAAGNYHSVAIRSDGMVRTWGSYNYHGQLDTPEGLSNIVGIAAGYPFSMALRSHGMVTRPRYIGKPINQEIVAGAPLLLRALAVGQQPLTYQWRLNGTNLIGAVDPSYSLSNVQSSNAGNYAVVVTNPFGSITGAVVNLTVSVPPPNHAPVLGGSAEVWLPTINENEFDNWGISVQELLASLGTNAVTDADDDLVGIAISALNEANGVWQYCPSNTYNWTSIGPVADATARLLGPQARLRFVPGRNYFGSVSPGFTFRIWDQTDGVETGLADASTNGGGSAFSAQTGSASVIVTPFPPPSNDDFEDRISLDGASLTTWGSTVGATRQIGEPNHGSYYAPGKSVWWAWSPPTNGIYAVGAAGQNLFGSYLDGVVAVYTGSTFSNLVSAGWDSLDGPANNGVVCFAALAGTEYLIVVDAENWPSSLPPGSENVVLTIGPTEPGPRFLTEPLDQTLFAGEYLSLWTKAVGIAPLGYQWRANGTNILGATNSYYYKPAVQPQQGGGYSLLVTNAFGAITSRVAQVTILPAPQGVVLLSPNASLDGSFTFEMYSPSNLTVVVQASTNLSTWTDLQTNSLWQGSRVQFWDNDTSKHGRRFYRLAAP